MLRVLIQKIRKENQPMNTVIFKAEDAIFQFDQESVMECLEHRKTLYEIKELDPLLDVITNEPEKVILFLEGQKYFGFIALDLINDGEGSVLCKTCSKQYPSNQLETFTVGPDDASIKTLTGKKKGLKGLFRKRPKPFGMYGGKGYKCPEGHELIFMRTWIT